MHAINLPCLRTILKLAIPSAAIAIGKPYVLPLLATGLAIGCLLLAGYRAIAPVKEDHSPLQPLDSAPHRQAQQDVSAISDLHLFGQTESSPSAQTAPRPEALQALQLKGVLLLNRQPARAVIELPDHSQKTYQPNDNLPGGAILQAIEPKKIIVLVDNRQESLFLPNPTSATTAPLPPAKKPTQDDYGQPIVESDYELVVQPPESLAN